MHRELGISANFAQFSHQLLQVLMVGLTIGMTRTVIPALAESDFGVPKDSFLLLSSFVIAFGLVKGIMNFVAGRLSETYGRKKILLAGWVFALPIPIMIWHAPNWNWIVAATILLGINQGLTWSMTQTSKLDITKIEERGLTLGLNEFSGYVGVALAGVITAYLASRLGARLGLLVFGLSITCTAIIFTMLWTQDSLAWTKLEATKPHADNTPTFQARCPDNVALSTTTKDLFLLMCWRDKRFLALIQAGLVEKFVDALVWIIYPVFLYQKGLSLSMVSWVIGIYGLVWGSAQLLTGKLSDHIGRHRPNVVGMCLCGAGVMSMVLGQGTWWWGSSAALSGFGMALLYPNLSAAVADISPPAWRGSAMGIYRFWRDLGYGIGALGLGMTAHYTGIIEAAFWFVSISMFISASLLWYWGEETHPKLIPAPPSQTSCT